MPLPLWIVVANGSRARVLERKHPGEALTQVREWSHPATRQQGQEAGHGHRHGGIRGRSGLIARSTAHDKERAVFAREICRWLAHSLNTHAMGSVALLSSNPFLGDLVSHGEGELHKHLCATHEVDLTDLPLPALAQRLHQDFRL